LRSWRRWQKRTANPRRLPRVNDQVRVFRFDQEESQRLDLFLVDRMPEYSRSFLQNLIKNGAVTIDGNAAGKTGVKLEHGQVVEVHVPPPRDTKLVPEAIPLDIICEDQDVIVINKPAGMVVHPSAGHEASTLVHAVLAHAPSLEGIGGEKRPGVVHRLDKNTSGLIIMAKNDRALQFLQDQFKQRTVEKYYLALVDGSPPTPTGRVEAALGRDPRYRQRFAVRTANRGRPAVTEYKTLESYPEHTLLEVRIFTGRTHQIRVHMAFIDCPVAGDTVYGHRHSTIPINRQFLHAARLNIKLPIDQKVHQFEAPLPQELEEVLALLEGKIEE
jgi:23S rRNA pseudouridine1911/1915/1917 synthase